MAEYDLHLEGTEAPDEGEPWLHIDEGDRRPFWPVQLILLMMIFCNCCHVFGFISHLKREDSSPEDFLKSFKIATPGNIFRQIVHWTVFGFSVYLYKTSNRSDWNVFAKVWILSELIGMAL